VFWKLTDACSPERTEYGVDYSRQNFECWEVASESVDDAIADRSYVFDDAAGESEVREPAGAAVGFAKALDDEICEVCQIFCFAAKDVLRDGVSLFRAPHHQRSEASEVWRGDLVGVTDERVEVWKLPKVENGR
jgi:hypothetical protein